MWQKYITAGSVEDVLTLLAEHQGAARVIAGGTDLLLEMERGKRPDVHVLIDITRIAGLDAITREGDTLRLGPLVTHNHVVAHPLIRQRALPLAQAAWEVGAPQIRNRATIAGNLITASSANDTITPLLVLGAEVVLASLDGERTVPLSAFYTGLRQTVMRPDEMLTAIHFPLLAETERGTFIKLGLRRAQAISVNNVAAVVRVEDGMVTRAALALGSVAPTVIRVPGAEAALVGQPLSDEVIRSAARIAAATPTPITDVRSTAEYRAEMVKVLVARALRQIRDDAIPTLPERPAQLWGEREARVECSAATTVHNGSGLPIEATINGQRVSVASGAHKTLLDWLRDDVGLKGTKEGCGEGECGACTVFLDGAAVMACMVAAPRAHGADIVTVEGLAAGDQLHPLQEAFVASGAVQCGFCTPGLLMAGAKLLEEHPSPTREQIEQSISGNLCRCTGYYKILEAFMKAGESAGGAGQ
ncbi:FAD binding domain-containing protein [Aggregatilineales bacterium SYSU G02658]